MNKINIINFFDSLIFETDSNYVAWQIHVISKDIAHCRRSFKAIHIFDGIRYEIEIQSRENYVKKKLEAGFLIVAEDMQYGSSLYNLDDFFILNREAIRFRRLYELICKLHTIDRTRHFAGLTPNNSLCFG